MTTNEYPRLCGGTFFTLLLQARKQRARAREHRKGERDGLAETDVFAALIKIINSDYTGPNAATKAIFKTNVSEYKSCKASASSRIHLPIDDTTAFNQHIIDDYQALLLGMCKFVDHVIDVGASLEKDVRLVKALLELIALDTSIDEEQEFYVCENGTSLKKGALRTVTEICLPSFLLGIWHFVLVNRKDNTVGKTTYETWCPSNSGSQRKYTGTMGSGICQDIKITSYEPVDSTEKSVNISEIEYEHTDEHNDSFADDIPGSETPESASQTINNHGFIFQQFGEDNKQIVGNITTLVINND